MEIPTDKTVNCRLQILDAVNETSIKMLGEKWFKDDPVKTVLFFMEEVTCEDIEVELLRFAQKIATWKMYKERNSI